jgi:hypothetical protein
MPFEIFGLTTGDLIAIGALGISVFTFWFGYVKARKSEKLRIGREDELRKAQDRAQKFELVQKRVDRIQRSIDKLEELVNRDLYFDPSQVPLHNDLRRKQWHDSIIDFIENASDFRYIFGAMQIENTPDIVIFQKKYYFILSRFKNIYDQIQGTAVEQSKVTYMQHLKIIAILLEWSESNLDEYGLKP